MLYPFFELAGRSLNRQRTFRRLMTAHLLLVGGTIIVHHLAPARNLFEMLGFALLIAGIVEGAMVIGWRLTQLPKSRSLEPLLLSPVTPRFVMSGEQLVGLAQFSFLTLSAAPPLALLVGNGFLSATDAVVVLTLGFTWGCVTGLGLTWWAYEPLAVRRWGERFSLAAILVYLIVGGLAGERTFHVLTAVSYDFADAVRRFFNYINTNNPFALIHRLASGREEWLIDEFLTLQAIGMGSILFFFLRAANRLKGHYLEQHYRPQTDDKRRPRGMIADRPLSWWAVRRVNEYPGQINLWLAAGATTLYAVFLLLHDQWPAWLGRNTFRMYEMLGGIAGFTTVLALLTAVPAAYQYGLWDSSLPERCKRLELLLTTELGPADYIWASWSAAWNRGRGYFVSALILWIAGIGAGRYSAMQALLAVMAGMSLVALYFAIGFRCFARNRGTTSLGFLLTVVLPLGVWGIVAVGGEACARVLPPGFVFYATSARIQPLTYFATLAATAGLTVFLLRQAAVTFDSELRAWYDEHHGAR